MTGATPFRGPLLGLAALLVFTVAAAGASRLWGGPAPMPQSSVAAMRDLVFSDRADGAVTVRDAAGGPVAVLPPGTNGFIRGALRGLARERWRGEFGGPETPFRVIDWTDGRLTLEDRATGRLIDLRAFGATNAAAFERLLTAREEEH